MALKINGLYTNGFHFVTLIGVNPCKDFVAVGGIDYIKWLSFENFFSKYKLVEKDV